MKNISHSLNNVKSRYFMLLACLSLLLATTSCNNDELEFNDLKPQKQYTKAELIEQALSRMPRTRAGNSGVLMITIQDTVKMRCVANEDVYVILPDRKYDTIKKGSDPNRIYVFEKKQYSYAIELNASEQAIRALTINDDGLILLDVSGNRELIDLFCRNNHLDAIDFADCDALKTLDISNNEFSSIDISKVPLYFFYAENNELTELDLSNNPNISNLCIGNNQLTELDVSGKEYLFMLEVEHNHLITLDVSGSPDLVTLDASFNPITDLNLGSSEALTNVNLERLPIKTFNGAPVGKADFSAHPILSELNLAYTPFDSLELSSNFFLAELDISGSSVTYLNVSPGIYALRATRSKLTNLLYDNLNYLYELRIERTPLENDNTKLIHALPYRSEMKPGHLYTYSLNSILLDIADSKNWLINR